MLAPIESFLHGVRRRLSRSEWAIRHLGLTPSEGTAEEPGLLLIQIDGLGRRQFERALAAGVLPTLARLQSREGAELHTFYSGLPSTTPAVQAELHYGVRAAVPAFSFQDRASGRLVRMWEPEWAKVREAACARHGPGLLEGGSSWSNLYTGGAGPRESHFCAASSGLGDLWRTGKVGHLLLFCLLNVVTLVRLAGLVTVEFARGLVDLVRRRVALRRWSRELLLVASRAFVGLTLRELVALGGQVELARGLPVVHLNFLGYDEEAHGHGPGSPRAFHALRGIDRSLARLLRAAHRSRRRDYAVWFFSDHGQEAVRPFTGRYPGGLDAALRVALSSPRVASFATPGDSAAAAGSAWVARRHLLRSRLPAAPDVPSVGADVTVVSPGPVAHVYLSAPLAAADRPGLARRLVAGAGIPGVLWREGDEVAWCHAGGITRLPEEVPAGLPHPEPLRTALAHDLAALVRHPDAGDLVLLGWSPGTAGAWSFHDERGAHGGCGPGETQGFLLLPAHTRLPGGTEHFVRPSALRAAARHHLRRDLVPLPRRPLARRSLVRVMTYNVHGCAGMDGRISPRRVARVLRSEHPDLVALQELDLGRRRSRAEDQAGIIAAELDLHLLFCPTLTRGGEHYGHAILSRWPLELVRRARLPADPSGWWREPRAALWVRVQHPDGPFHLLTTHLGLGIRERVAQARALAGPEWLGGLGPTQPVLLAGDLNALPGSRPHRLLAQHLRDLQAGPGHRAAATFTSAQPVLRLDHLFASRHFERLRVAVVANDLTRVASDHLPLVADLRVVPAAAGRPRPTPPG